jgi:membrane-associated phospholipid phosphatase
MVSEIMGDALFILGLVLLGMAFGSKKGLVKGIAYMFIGAVVVTAIKLVLWEARPCSGMDFCLADSGVVSGHAMLSMMFALAYYNKKEFLFFLLLAFAVMVSRMYFGMHDIAQVTRSVCLAVLLDYGMGVIFGGTGKKG